MTADEALNAARQLLLSPEMAPIIETALTQSNDVATGAAVIVGPLVVRMMQETDVPDEELLGDEQNDGIAIRLLEDIFEVAGDAGVPGTDDRQMAERAVQLVADMLAQSVGQSQQPPQQQPQPRPSGLLSMG